MQEGGGASRSTDPAAGSSAATDVSLREFLTLMVQAEMRRVNERFHAVEEATKAAFENSQRAIDKADTATEKRFEGVNEFRAALADQAANFVTRKDLEALAEKMEIQITSLRESRAEGVGQATGTRLTWGAIAATVATAATILGILVLVGTYLSTR